MEYDKIKYLKGNKELLRLADEDYRDFIFYQSFDGIFRPVKFKNRYRKSRFENEDCRFKQPEFSAIKAWSSRN